MKRHLKNLPVRVCGCCAAAGDATVCSISIEKYDGVSRRFSCGGNGEEGIKETREVKEKKEESVKKTK